MNNRTWRTAITIQPKWWNGIWVALLVIYVLAGVGIVPFHGDEATQIYMSRDYTYQFIQHDLSTIYYSSTPANQAEQELRLLNGTINKYTMGLAGYLAGFTFDDINEQWDWGADWHYNHEYDHAPSAELLRVSRWPSTLFTAASVIVIFAIGYALQGRPVAYLASLYYALNPVILLNGRRAMMEGSLLFFALTVVLAGIIFLRRRTVWTALLLGLAAGLAIASKHTAVLTVVSVFAVCVLYPLLAHFADQKRAHPESVFANYRRFLIRHLLLLVLASVITLVVFLALNPAWWAASPLETGSYVLGLRENLLKNQVKFFGGYSDWADQLAGFGRQTWMAIPQYYEAANWADFIGDQISVYESSGLRGASVGEIGGGSAPIALGLLAMSVAGLVALIRDKRPANTLVVVWAVFILVTTFILTPLEWQRYYLLVYPAVGLLMARGLVGLVRQLRLFRQVENNDRQRTVEK